MSIKKTVRVVIEKEIEIELKDSIFECYNGNIEKYLEDFRSAFWDVESIDDVIEYVAENAFEGREFVKGVGQMALSQGWGSDDVEINYNIISEELMTEVL